MRGHQCVCVCVLCLECRSVFGNIGDGTEGVKEPTAMVLALIVDSISTAVIEAKNKADKIRKIAWDRFEDKDDNE